jgi:hypothetical protein
MALRGLREHTAGHAHAEPAAYSNRARATVRLCKPNLAHRSGHPVVPGGEVAVSIKQRVGSHRRDRAVRVGVTEGGPETEHV